MAEEIQKAIANAAEFGSASTPDPQQPNSMVNHVPYSPNSVITNHAVSKSPSAQKITPLSVGTKQSPQQRLPGYTQIPNVNATPNYGRAASHLGQGPPTPQSVKSAGTARTGLQPSIFIFDEIFLTTCKDLAKYGYNESAVPSGIKEWCAGKVFSIIPKAIVQQIFTLVLTYKDDLSSLHGTSLPNGLCITYSKTNNSTYYNSGRNNNVTYSTGYHNSPTASTSQPPRNDTIHIDDDQSTVSDHTRRSPAPSSTSTNDQSHSQGQTVKEYIPKEMLSLLGGHLKRERSESTDNAFSPKPSPTPPTLDALRDTLRKLAGQSGSDTPGIDVLKDVLRTKSPITAPREKRFKCIHCDKCYGRSQHLSRHVREAHQDKYQESRASPGYRCQHCTEVFSMRTLRTFHVRTTHANLFSYNCEICPPEFLSPNDPAKVAVMFEHELDYLKHIRQRHLNEVDLPRVAVALQKREITKDALFRESVTTSRNTSNDSKTSSAVNATEKPMVEHQAAGTSVAPMIVGGDGEGDRPASLSPVVLKDVSQLVKAERLMIDDESNCSRSSNSPEGQNSIESLGDVIHSLLPSLEGMKDGLKRKNSDISDGGDEKRSTFGRDRSSREHVERVYHCNVDACDKKYGRKSHLQRHIRTTHRITDLKSADYSTVHPATSYYSYPGLAIATSSETQPHPQPMPTVSRPPPTPIVPNTHHQETNFQDIAQRSGYTNFEDMMIAQRNLLSQQAFSTPGQSSKRIDDDKHNMNGLPD